MKQRDILNILKASQNGKRWYIACDCDDEVIIVETSIHEQRGIIVKYTGWTLQKRQVMALLKKGLIVRTKLACDIDADDDMVIFAYNYGKGKVVRTQSSKHGAEYVMMLDGSSLYSCRLDSHPDGWCLTGYQQNAVVFSCTSQKSRQEIVFGHIIHKYLRVVSGVETRVSA